MNVLPMPGLLNALHRSAVPSRSRAECRSRIFRFVDDVEIHFDDDAKLIHFRSAARLGRRDFGVNRERMERVRQDFLAGS